MTTSSEHYANLEGLIEQFDLGEFDDCYRCVGCERLVTPENRICPSCDPLVADANDSEVDRQLNIADPAPIAGAVSARRPTGRPV